MLTFFDDIKGQTKAKQLLEKAISHHKTSHAYLFKGPAGVGKKMTAHAFASLVNCHAPTATRICGNCPSCKKFKSSNHPDYHVVEPDGAGIKIEQIRALQKQLAFPPFEAKTRIIILADIHETMRRPEVANSLLKTLEEPPDNTMIILTGDEAGTILPTIISRCQVIPFSPLPFEDVATLLREDAIPHDQAITLARIAEGSIGRARHHLEKDFLTMRRTIITILTETKKHHPMNVERVYTIAQQAGDLKDDSVELLDLLTSWLRDLVILATTPPPHENIINQDLDHQGGKQWTSSGLTACLKAISKARLQLQRNCNRALVFEVLFFALLDEKC